MLGTACRFLARGAADGGCRHGVIGGVIERLLLRRLAGQQLAQVLVTLGISFIVADLCLMVWTGDPDAGGAARRLARRRHAPAA